MRELMGMAAVVALLALGGCASYASKRLQADDASPRTAEIFGDIEQREFGKRAHLILPCFVVPTQTNDLDLHVRAAVIDVRNDLIYATFEDHRQERIHATVAGESDSIEEGFDRLYAESLVKLRVRVAERLRQLEVAP